jgi:hypothetical protein
VVGGQDRARLFADIGATCTFRVCAWEVYLGNALTLNRAICVYLKSYSRKNLKDEAVLQKQ